MILALLPLELTLFISVIETTEYLGRLFSAVGIGKPRRSTNGCFTRHQCYVRSLTRLRGQDCEHGRPFRGYSYDWA